MNTPNPRATALPVNRLPLRGLGLGLVFAAASLLAGEEVIGEFAGQTDIGAPKLAGSAVFEKATGDYVVQGGGANMWFKTDSFHYVWRKVFQDSAIDAEISFPQPGGNNHRKGVLMIRQSLDPDSAYVDVAVHGDGLTSLQFREAQGDNTHEVQATIKGPQRVRLDKVGNYVHLSVAAAGGSLTPAGSSARVVFKAPFYIGIGVCSHDDATSETVRFRHVGTPPASASVAAVRSTLEYVKVPSGDRVCVRPGTGMITAAGWAADGSLQAVPAVPAASGVSPDGKWQATLEHQADVAVLTLRPAAGGDARVLMRLPDQADAPLSISWSPDSTKIGYVRVVPR